MRLLLLDNDCFSNLQAGIEILFFLRLNFHANAPFALNSFENLTSYCVAAWPR